MSAELAARALKLFEAALDVEPDDRADWIGRESGGDRALAAEVESLLAAHTKADKFLPTDETNAPTEAPRSPAVEPNLADSELPSAGTRLGDFLIEKQIGSGGMGVVYQAQQISLNRRVALKVLPAHLRFSSSAQARFRHEIEAAARLQHTNIVAVYTSGDSDNTQYYAMELIDGPPLSDVIKQLRTSPVPELRSASTRGNLAGDSVGEENGTPANQAIDSERPQPGESLFERSGNNYFDSIATLLADVAEGLAYAHQQKVVHRDIKPSNLLFSQDGRLHVSDFGLARMLEQPGITHTGEIVGTPFYMAPEQISAGAGKVDGRTDIYAIGATLYELLTLQPPFPGDSRDQVIAQISRDEPLPPRRLNKRVPRDLDTICLKALEKEPSRRYQTADQLAADLRAYVHRFAISAQRAGPVARTTKWARRHRGLTFALATASALAAVALFFAFRAHQSQSRWSAAQQEQVFETALLAALEGKQDDARSAVVEAERLGAPPERMHLLQGQVDLIAARYTHAHEHFMQAADQLPDSVAAQSLLALSCMRRHFYDQGETVFHRVRKLTPLTLDDYLYKARVEAYFNADAAVKTLDAAIERDKSSFVARLIRAEVQTGRAIDTADPNIAEAALADYGIARELLGDNPLVTGGHMMALLAAATAYDSRGLGDRRDQQLRRAAELAVVLGNFDTYRAHRARAFYFDYIGDIDQALAEWGKFQNHDIVFQVLALYREGRLNEALKTCHEFQKDNPGERIVEFFSALIVAAQDGSPEAVRKIFPVRDQDQLNPIHELLTVFTVTSLTSGPTIAQGEAARLRRVQRLPAFRNDWYSRLSAYTTGKLEAAEFLQETVGSRKRQCEAHYYVGITELGSGNRDAAREHFQRSAEARVFSYLEHFLSRALLAQLERDPNWPPWIRLEASESTSGAGSTVSTSFTLAIR